ncbi:DUF6776 family protein [Acinetobacter sp.]|uniref:DUF6776 family protein n=1 Tax=Acinetobacter sp. TaxID=472 RepID=UPI00388EE348
MQDTDSNTTTPKPMLQGNLPLVIGAAILMLGSGFLAYSVGHRQGLTVTGYDADAEQLVDVVQKQKASLEALNKSLNAAIQERDVAVTNSNDLYNALNQAKANQEQAEGMNAIYRDVLKQRGGLSLTIQNLGIKSLPENVYEYQIDLVQVSPNNRRAVGNVELRLIQGTEVLSVPLEATQFGFEHFERLTGRWTMPKGFSPQFIEVRLTGSTPVTKRFGWSRGQAIESPSAFVSEIPQVEANAQ